jgi:hypothetical protein
MRAGSLPGPDGAFASSPLPIAPHKAGVIGNQRVRTLLAARDMPVAIVSSSLDKEPGELQTPLNFANSMNLTVVGWRNGLMFVSVRLR